MAAAEATIIINQARISDQVYQYLRSEIVEGRLAPGERISLSMHAPPLDRQPGRRAECARPARL